MPESRKASIKQEWAWYCPSCKARNCTEPVVAELSPYEQIEIKREHGFSDLATGDFFTVPTVVTCCECHEDFDTEVT